MKCQGQCQETGKTLYPIDITNSDTGKIETKMYCTDCVEVHDIEFDALQNKLILDEQIAINTEDACIPLLFKDKGFDDFISDPVILSKCFSSRHVTGIGITKEIVRRFLDTVLSGEGVMMALVGEYGTGKSLLAAICINEVLKKGGRAKFEHTGRLLRRLMNNETYEEIIVSLASCDLVVLDDLSSTNISQFTEKSLSDLIDAIYSSQKSLIITANGQQQDLEKFIGERGHDRVAESPDGVVKCNWKSFRGTEIQSK